MSRKRKNTRFFLTKENQLIRTRLIEISLKVENLVYYNKPITMEEAKIYIAEVKSYKTQCCEDEKSLQVIDKLNRCMKAIIAEQKELKLNHDKANDENIYSDTDVRANCVSPVYSLPDEDRTQLSQNQIQRFEKITPMNGNREQLINNMAIKQNIEVNGGSVSVQYKDIERKQYYNDNINLNSITIDDKDLSSPTINLDIEIHKSLANLNVNDCANLNEDENTAVHIDTDYSQSILNNIDVLYYFTAPQIQVQDADITDNLIINNNNELIPLDNSANNKDLATNRHNKAKTFSKNPKPVFTKSYAEGSQKLIKDSKLKDKLEVAKIHLNGSINGLPETIEPVFIKSYAADSQTVMTDSNINHKLEMTKTVHVDIPGSTNNNNNNIVVEYSALEKSLNINHNKLENKKPIVFNSINNSTTVPKSKSTINVNIMESTNQKSIPIDHSITTKSNDNNFNAKNQSLNFEEPPKTIKMGKGNSHNIYGSNGANFIQQPCLSVNNITTCSSCDDPNIICTNIKNYKGKKTKNKTGVNINKENLTNSDKKKRAPRQKKMVKPTDDKTEGMKSKSNQNHDNNKSKDNKPKRNYSRNLNNQNAVISRTNIPTYNKNISNNLSWLENIRFVRKINENEYDHKLLVEKNFWDNYSLPANFKQDDFL